MKTQATLTEIQRLRRNLIRVGVVMHVNTKDAPAVAAAKLSTPRKINGIDFDGPQDINLKSSNLGMVGIVETGTGTGFHWRKFSDGKTEVFARFNLTIGAPLDVVFPKVFTETHDDFPPREWRCRH